MKIKPNLLCKNTFSRNSRRFIGALPTAFYLMLAALLHYSSSAVAATTTFTLQDQTGLPGAHKIWVSGWSNTPLYYLNSDGTWIAFDPPKPSDSTQRQTWQIPCYQLGTGAGQISKMVMDPSQFPMSGRVYYFIDDQGTYPACNNGTTTGPTSTSGGIFNTSYFSITYNPDTRNYGGIVGIPPTTIGQNTDLPVYSFGEFSPGPFNGVIDVSQVDFFSFPVTIQASVISQKPSTVGNTLGSDAMHSISYSDNAIYSAYINNLADPNNGCGANRDLPVCAYLDLISPYGNYFSLLNPGGFLDSNSSNAQKSKLQNAFDSVISKLWANGAPAITLNNGGVQNGNAPQEDFIGTTVTMTYPCNATGAGCPTVQAIKFVGQSGYVAYIFSPIGYAAGCAGNTPTITGCPAGSIASSGNQVFSGSGVFASTSNAEYTNLVAIQGLPTATTNLGVGTYNAQVARLGLIMTQAMNHGVALMQCAPATWQCWNVETNWYPKVLPPFPDITTQNLFSQFMHTASNMLGIPFFVRPPDAVQSAGGQTMGMAYGFSNDEQPTPPFSATNPQVPSKMDGTVVYGGPGPYTITFGPWASPLDCVFNWAAAKDPNDFSPASVPTQYGAYNGQYYVYRNYTNTQSYLGYYTGDGHVYYYLKSSSSLQDAGNYSNNWASQTGC